MPQCFGQESPEARSCCELSDPLIPTQAADLEPHKKLIVGGAMKGGTSFLFKQLVMDLRAAVSSACYNEWERFPKESYFFTQIALHGDDFKNYEKGMRYGLEKWRENCPSCSGKPILADFTPLNMKMPAAVCRIKKLWPEAKFVLLVRDPVQRAIS